MKTSDISVELIDHCGNDLSVVNAARVSFHKESEYDVEHERRWVEEEESEMDFIKFVLKPADKKLINYLAKHKHKSPFNHAFMSFRVKAPIFVARQLVKHEYLPWNEVSRRYVTDEPEFYFPEYWRKAAENVKQGSSDEKVDYSYSYMEFMQKHTEETLNNYKALLKAGVCAEQARMVLPQNTMTEWIWSGTLYAFAKMCKLRLDPHSQKETRIVAELISNEAKDLFPVSWPALLEYGE